MATTGAQIITNRARLYLNDRAVQTNARTFQDADLLVFLNDAETAILSMRSDARLDANGAVIVPVALTAIADSINVADKWAEPIACYLASKALAMQATDKTNLAASKTYWDMFIDALKTM